MPHQSSLKGNGKITSHMNLRTLLEKCNMYNFFAISFHNIIVYTSISDDA